MVRIVTSQEPAVVLQRCEARLTTPQIKIIRRDSRLSAKGEEGGDDEDGQGGGEEGQGGRGRTSAPPHSTLGHLIVVTKIIAAGTDVNNKVMTDIGPLRVEAAKMM